MSNPKQEREFKGIWIPASIYLNASLAWSAKIIWAEIDSFTGNDKDCFCSNRYFAELIGISETQVSKHITTLLELNLIELISFNGRVRRLRSITPTDSRVEQNAKPAFNLSSKLPLTNKQGSFEDKLKDTNTSTYTLNFSNKIKTKLRGENIDLFPDEILQARELAYLEAFAMNNFPAAEAQLKLTQSLERLRNEYSYYEFRDMGHLKNTFKKIALEVKGEVKSRVKKAQGNDRVISELERWHKI